MQRLASLHLWTRKNPKTARLAAQASVIGGLTAALALTPGCNLVNPPKPEPTPTEVPKPKPDLFDPKDGLTTLSPLNGAAGLPDKFRVVNILSGDLLQLQSLTGTPGKYIGGTADVYRLAGIRTPQPGQPGYAEVVRFIAKQTLGAGKEVDVEQDPRFPQDLSGRRRVQVFYTQDSGAFKGQKVLLNRMMVRLGWAVVDINDATSIDVRSWLNDEEYARKKKIGLNQLGIFIGERIPLGAPKGVLRAPGERIAPPGRPGARPGRPGGGPGRPGGPGGRFDTRATTGAPGGPPPGGVAPGGSPGASSGPPPGAPAAAPPVAAPGGASNSTGG